LTAFPTKKGLGVERLPIVIVQAPRVTGRAMTTSLVSEYFPILVFLAIAIVIAGAAVGASLVVGKQNPDSEKLSAYECGFDAFADARSKFDVRFYLVSILFIIFDLEVAFLFPWAVSLGKIGMFGFWSMVVFLGVLTVGFVYEWKKGALEWE
jgi:NADH-quinone oxidoreductase subunit A